MSIENPHISQNDSDFLPLLTTKDWGEEWVKLQRARGSSDNSAFWDKRAETYNKPFGHSSYSRQFIEFAGIEKGESVFDMGCGTGAISIPLAMEGHDVLGADFSSGMLARLKEEAEKDNIRDIEIVQMSWEDDWASHGVSENSFDVAIASRSIATADLKAALLKLSSVARRKCAITISAGSSPRSDQEILSDIGIQPFIGRDFVYAFMILVDAAYTPEVRYIISERRDSFKNESDAYASLKKMIDDVAYMVPQDVVGSAYEKLKDWVGDNLVENPDVGETNERGELQEKYILRNPRKIIWAHLSWEV